MQRFQFDAGYENTTIVSNDPTEARMTAGFSQLQAGAMEYLKKHAEKRGFVLMYVAEEDDQRLAIAAMTYIPPDEEGRERIPAFVTTLRGFANVLDEA